MAVIIGTPMPATMRVVQIEPAPMPTLTASTPSAMSACVPSAVATLPATRSMSGKRWRTRRTMSSTPCEWPCAVSITSTSTLAATSASARSTVSRAKQIHQPPLVAACVGDRHTGDAVLLHEVERFVDLVGGGKRDRVDDHAALRALHPIHFRRLFFD